MLEDVAGVSALGSKKRIQHKRRLIGEAFKYKLKYSMGWYK